MNATSHGLRATPPVVPGENPAAWESCRDAILPELTLAGVETEPADRVMVLS